MPFFKALRSNRFFVFLFKTRTIFQRDKPYVQIIYLNTKRSPVTQKTAEKFSINGCIIDKDIKLRKAIKLGGSSSAITLPDGWLKSMSLDEHVQAQLILAENEEMYILLCKPKPEETMVKT